jgi:hypothetical protein
LFFSPIRGQNKKRVTHQISVIIRCQAMLLFKICIALMVQALQGGGGGDEIKPKKAKKMTKKNVFDALCKTSFIFTQFF